MRGRMKDWHEIIVGPKVVMAACVVVNKGGDGGGTFMRPL